MDFVMPKYVTLKGDSTYDETWLTERIVENPGLLGLGDLDVRDRERRQPSAGRLDLLLSDPETDTRYEVEVQLGPTDESHLVRTIEYWDIERRRYPQYDHIAVLVAEDVTSRFLNVIGLFNQSIPLIAIQLRAVQVHESLTLVATQILDLMPLGTEEEVGGQPVDRANWEDRASSESLSLCDRLVEMIAQVEPGMELSYKKHYIGLSGPRGVRNFVTFYPRKKFIIVHFKIPFNAHTAKQVEESSLGELSYEQRGKFFRVRLYESHLEESREVIKQLIEQARDHFGLG